MFEGSVNCLKSRTVHFCLSISHHITCSSNSMHHQPLVMDCETSDVLFYCFYTATPATEWTAMWGSSQARTRCFTGLRHFVLALLLGSRHATHIRAFGEIVEAKCVFIILYTLWLFNIAMENGLFIDGLPLPIKNW